MSGPEVDIAEAEPGGADGDVHQGGCHEHR